MTLRAGVLVAGAPGFWGAFFGAGLGAGCPGIVMPGGRQIAPRHCCDGVDGLGGVEESDDESGPGWPGFGGFDGVELDDFDEEGGRLGSGIGLVGMTPVAYAAAQASTLFT